MRQVPHYLLIGNGRVARHFAHYFSLLALSYHTWSRQEPEETLHNLLPQATHVLLLISDSAIDAFINNHLTAFSGLLIHFSGSLVSAKAYGAHPLMCFNQDTYSLEEYQRIPFVIDHSAPPFATLLPGIPNEYARLDVSLKAKYHALCVLSGNFSCLLWQKLFMSFEQELQLPAHIAHPYLKQQMQNLLTDPNTALTGPLVRNDQATIQKNLAALANDPFIKIYQSFVTCYEQLKK